MRFGDWMRLLAENRFRVHPFRWVMVGLISSITPFNSVMSRVQRWIYGRRIAATPVEPPLFIIGHWRSGTTYLHELLMLDDRFTYPTTYQCFAPFHFLLTQWFLARYCGFLLPRKRPMDNVRAGWQRPQEDEFALLTMGVPTPYRRMAFPNHEPRDLEYLNTDELDAPARAAWSAALRQFVQTLTFADPKRVVLKSPTHTGRIALLAELFPGAQFIHLTRHPDDLFPSTRRLWMSLDAVQGCQVPRNEHLDQYVFTCLRRMYAGFENQRVRIDPEQVIDVRYEDLVADPVGVVERIYERLQLHDFAPLRTRLEAFVRDQTAYQANRHKLDAATRAEIRRQWSDYFSHYGYSPVE
jgi:omega-hydroxy-beta-dihydromenaquinone-9 sulfotransferase